MDTERIQMKAETALPIVGEMIKFSYLTDKIGKSSGWIYNKMNSGKTTTLSSGFNKYDLYMLNEALHHTAEILLNMRIAIPEPDPENPRKAREEIIAQIKKISEIVSMPFIYEDRMGKTSSWYMNRVRNKTRCQFTSQDIAFINMVVVEIANKLNSIELIL